MKNKLLLKITFMLVGFAVMGDMVIIPAIGGFMGSFPEASKVQLDMFLVYPLLASVIGSILCGYLTQYISKKYLLTGAYVLFIIAACGGALINNIHYILTMRMLVGFTYGFVPTVAMGLIAEVFMEEEERSSMMGIYNSATTVLGALMSLVSGYLAVGDWHHSYYIYLTSIPIFLMIIAFIPKTPPEGKKASATSPEKGRVPWAKFLPVAMAYLVFNILYSIIMYFVGIYVEETKLGDASTTGILSMAGSVGMFLGGLVFSKVYMRIKRGMPIIIFLLTALAYVVMAYPSNAWIIGAMCLLGGLAYGFSVSYYYMYTSMIVPENVTSLAMGILGAGLSLGGFFSAYVRDFYKALLGVDTIAPTFLYIGITCAVCGVLSIILTIRSRKNPVMDNQAGA
ncbi:MAG: MFS transporter [Clostridiales bacterium]|jgi:MFS family permease|nr:MFS transporter [Eubacteriales bacterium]MDH7567930.1 MFS transporter [Clostridiales bacterium]